MGHEVHVAYSSNPTGESGMRNVALRQLKARRSCDPTLIGELASYIRQVRPDVVHTWLLKMDVAGGIAARLTHTPWILREPSSAMAYPPSWKNFLRARVASAADAIVSNSEGGDACWTGRIEKNRRYIVRNGVPLDQIAQVSAALPEEIADPGTPIVLGVARLSSDWNGNKNLRTWLEALARVRQQQDVCGILCGEGPQRPELEALIRSLGLSESVTLTGNLPGESVWALMKKAAVFMSLSAFEGCPNTVLEAMACGCPAIVSNIPAHREILDDHSASFVDPARVEQVAAAILGMLSAPDAAADLARAARRRTEAWSVQEMARGFERVYEDVVRCAAS
jgi:glycosyltransferase involved in cell wall biosynthesis